MSTELTDRGDDVCVRLWRCVCIPTGPSAPSVHRDQLKKHSHVKALRQLYFQHCLLIRKKVQQSSNLFKPPHLNSEPVKKFRAQVKFLRFHVPRNKTGKTKTSPRRRMRFYCCLVLKERPAASPLRPSPSVPPPRSLSMWILSVYLFVSPLRFSDMPLHLRGPRVI